MSEIPNKKWKKKKKKKMQFLSVVTGVRMHSAIPTPILYSSSIVAKVGASGR